MSWTNSTDIVNDFFQMSNGNTRLFFAQKKEKKEDSHKSEIEEETEDFGAPDTKEIASSLLKLKGPIVDETRVFPIRYNAEEASKIVLQKRHEFDEYMANEAKEEYEKSKAKSVRDRNVLLTRFEKEIFEKKHADEIPNTCVDGRSNKFIRRRMRMEKDREFAQRVSDELNQYAVSQDQASKNYDYVPMMENNQDNFPVFDDQNFPAL